MILVVKTNKRSRGFTLIEIVIVLGVAALIIGGAVGTIINASDERALRKTTGEVELMAKRARMMAILKQTPFALEFREGVIRLMPLAQAGLSTKKQSVLAEEANSIDENRELRLEGGIETRILRWGSEKWLTTQNDAIHIWRFDPDGLCEPISLRVLLDKSFVQETFHPLTAIAIEAEGLSEIQ